MRAEIHDLLPTLADHNMDHAQGFLCIAFPDLSDPLFKQPSTKDTAMIKALAVPGEPISVSQVLEECTSIFRCRVVTHHPNFFSFIPSTMLPVSRLANMVISAFNPHVGGNLAGSSCNDIEESLMKWLVSKIGSPSEEATGLTVSEGSMANLMALAAACGQVVSGPQDHHQAVIYVSEKSHFSIAETARVLGFSEKQIRNVPNFQPECLASLVRDDRALGLISTDQVWKMLDHGVEMAETAEAALRARAHWKIISPAQMAILVFRFEPNGHTEPEICQLNDKITDVALDKNIVAIQTVRFRGQLAMRMCIINLRFTAEQLVTIINALDNIAIRLSL